MQVNLNENNYNNLVCIQRVSIESLSPGQLAIDIPKPLTGITRLIIPPKFQTIFLLTVHTGRIV